MDFCCKANDAFACKGKRVVAHHLGIRLNSRNRLFLSTLVFACACCFWLTRPGVFPDKTLTNLASDLPAGASMAEVHQRVSELGFDFATYELNRGIFTQNGASTISPPVYRQFRDDVRPFCLTPCTIIAVRKVVPPPVFPRAYVHVYQYLWVFREEVVIAVFEGNFSFRANL